MKLARMPFLAVSLAFIACASSDPLAPPSFPAEVAVHGSYYHTVTRLKFPESLAGFSRTRVSQFDPDALNVAAHYKLTGAPQADATVYHYPATYDDSMPTYEMFEEHFRFVKRDIEVGTPGGSLIEESEYNTRINGFEFRGLRAVYQFPRFHSYSEPVDSTVYLFLIENWYLKFRFTYPRKFSSEMDFSEKKFISAVRWDVPSDEPAAAAPNKLPPDWAEGLLSDWFEGSDRIHQAVQFHEREPLSETAELVRGILLAHYKQVDYIICGHVLGSLFSSDEDAHSIIGMQIIFASGDWVEQNPERSHDIDAYTLAGLKSGLRTYATILKSNPGARFELLDELLEMYRSDELRDWYADNTCRPK